MGRMIPLTIDVSETDLADLEDWARNREQPVGDLLNEALRHYMKYIHADHAELERRSQGPFYSIEDVEARLAARRQHQRVQAAE